MYETENSQTCAHDLQSALKHDIVFDQRFERKLIYIIELSYEGAKPVAITPYTLHLPNSILRDKAFLYFRETSVTKF